MEIKKVLRVDEIGTEYIDYEPDDTIHISAQVGSRKIHFPIIRMVGNPSGGFQNIRCKKHIIVLY